MRHGMIRVASAVPQVRVADPHYNVEQMLPLIDAAIAQHASLIVFPELSLTGSSCQDLFQQQLLHEQTQAALIRLLEHTENKGIAVVAGLPVCAGGQLFNCAAVVCDGKVDALVPKTYLSTGADGGETRWFDSARQLQQCAVELAGNQLLLTPKIQRMHLKEGASFGIEIGTDLWASTPMSTRLTAARADFVVGLASHVDLVGRHRYVHEMVKQQSARLHTAYVYSSSGYGESTTDGVCGGCAMVYEEGHLLAEGKRFSMEPQVVYADIDIELLRHERRRNDYDAPQMGDRHHAQPENVTDTEVYCLEEQTELSLTAPLLRPLRPLPFIPEEAEKEETYEEILQIQSLGLARRMQHIGCQKVVIGISGGLDSTLALLVTVRAFDAQHLDRKGIVGITMPGFGTSSRTHDNAVQLMEALGITTREISIAKAVEQHFIDIGHDMQRHDVTYENAQARERTQILMDVANEENAIVVGTGDLSELALGWATYNGDHMSMYGVNAGVPKTLVRQLVKHVASQCEQPDSEQLELFGNPQKSVAQLLDDIVATPISPELLPEDKKTGKKQQTEDSVGPYELHDFFIFYMLRYGFSPKKVYFLAQHAFKQHQPRYSDKEIKKWLTVFCRRFFTQQFKRSCLPDGPQVGSVCLSPRGAWMMPSDAMVTLWMNECQQL